MPQLSPQLNQGYQIGQAAQRSGVSAANIRYYEKEKLVPARGTGDNGYRLYSDVDIHQLRFIRMLRSLDMSLH
jgi:DNA-binding transcriptional MerR regulator